MGAFNFKSALRFVRRHGSDVAEACELIADLGEHVGVAPTVADTLRTAADAGRIASGQPRTPRKQPAQRARAAPTEKSAPIRTTATVCDTATPPVATKRRKARSTQPPAPPVHVLTATVGTPDPNAWKRHLPKMPK